MPLRDTFHFNESRYRESHYDIPYQSAIDKHRSKIREMSGFVSRGAIGVAFTHATGGLSLIGTVYAIRQFCVVQQQSRILEAILMERWNTFPITRTQDIVIGMIVGAGAAVAGHGALHGFEYLAEPFMHNAASLASSLQVTEMNQEHFTSIPILEHFNPLGFDGGILPSVAVGGFMDGVQSAHGGQGLVGAVSQLGSTPWHSPAGAVSAIGQAVGFGLEYGGFNYLADLGVDHGGKYVGRMRRA